MTNDVEAAPPMQTTLVRKHSDETPSVIGIAGTGTGNAVTVKSMPAWQMIAIRVARMYLQTVVGFLGAEGVGVDLGGLAGVFLLALAPTIVSLLHNTLEILTKLDVTHPQLRA